MFVEFNQNVTVGGVPYKRGQLVDVSELESGCITSCLRMKRCVECDAPKPQPQPKPKLAPTTRRTKSKE